MPWSALSDAALLTIGVSILALAIWLLLRGDA